MARAWRFARFEELSARDIHDLFEARLAVFVVEQACVFQDIDGLDPRCWHLLGRGAGEGAKIESYCRIVPPGLKFAEPSIGRVLTTREARGSGAGRELVREALARTGELWPGRDIRISAQSHLQAFYAEFGFVAASAPYEEDGILHVDMLRAVKDQQPA